MKISYYDGNITHPIARGYISIDRMISSIKDTTPKMKTLLDEIAEASARGDKEQKMLLKRNLHYFTPTAVIPIGERRRYDNIVGFNPIMVLDFDNEPRAEDLKKYLWETYPQIFCAYLSPSKQGVKALMRIPQVESIEEYKAYFRGFQVEVSDSGIETLDNCNLNCIQPLYLSNDADLLHRYEVITWDKKVIAKTQHLEIKPPPIEIEGDETVYKSRAYYRRITIDIFTKKVRDIVGEPGHTRYRDACILLGSRVGAGYISHSDALALAEHELNQNSYLQKNLAGYWKTGQSRIEIGINNPIYYG